MVTKPKGFTEMFRSDKWLLIPGIILAVILAIVVRGNRTGSRTTGPSVEPTITVYFHETGQVKSMPLETYLEGVVAAEMDPNWPMEALEAQAIVARTFTLRKMEEGPIPGRGTNASTDPKEFQAYNASRVNDRVKQAVQNTRGKVITYKGKPILAWFHASSGGITASAVEGLGFKKEPTPYASPVPDVQAQPVHTWFYRFPTSEVIRAAAETGVTLDKVTSIQIGRKGPSGRAETLIISGKEVSAPAFRLAIGANKMKSTLLDQVQLEGNSVYMKGRGEGHGVGLSQWGAWLMAQQGKSSEEIVRYYFKGVKIESKWK